MSKSQEYLDSVYQRLLSDNYLDMPQAPAPASSGPMGAVMAFLKKYWIHIIVVIVLIVLISYFASANKVASFASISGNEEEDTATWEQTQYALPPSPYEPTEAITA